MPWVNHNLIIGVTLNHVDQFLAIFDSPFPLWTDVDFWMTPPNNYVVFWKAPPLYKHFLAHHSTAYIVCKSVDKIFSKSL